MRSMTGAPSPPPGDWTWCNAGYRRATNLAKRVAAPAIGFTLGRERAGGVPGRGDIHERLHRLHVQRPSDHPRCDRLGAERCVAVVTPAIEPRLVVDRTRRQVPHRNVRDAAGYLDRPRLVDPLHRRSDADLARCVEPPAVE